MTTAIPADKPPRKFPPPCWTQEEALVLIEAYRERWYALGRGYLRTVDWDSVADEVGKRCPDASPVKTSAQCRHKIEKLRQRYRAEKQRALSYPGRFFSSWFYFDSMDAMENGSTPGSDQHAPIDQNSGALGFNLKNRKKIDGDFSNPKLGVDSEGGFQPKVVNNQNSVPLGFRLKNSNKKSNPNLGHRVSNGYTSYFDGGSDEEDDNGSQSGGGPTEFRGEKFGSGIRIKTPIDQSIMPDFRSRKFGKIDVKLDPDFDSDDGDYDAVDADGDYWMKVSRIRNSVPAGTRGKFHGKTDRNSNPNFDPRVLKGFPTQARPVFEKRSGGVKRGRSAVEDMVASIKLLGEGFVKMEKMKMEMAKEIDKMRMEMEMKRNELLLESQQQIVDAFVKGLFESKKIKTTVSPDS